MKLRILLVNPWIYDFAAYNLRARPLGLLLVLLELSREQGAFLALIGGILFMTGTVTLLMLKMKRESRE